MAARTRSATSSSKAATAVTAGWAARISARESAAPVRNTGIENGATGDSPSIFAVSVVWGEHPGAGTFPDADLGFPRIRATVAPAPYDATRGRNTGAPNCARVLLWSAPIMYFARRVFAR
jgi:hypothetical protein